MKLYKWLLMGFGGTFLALAFFMIVPVIIMDLSWWWFFAPFIFFIIAWIIVGIVLLITRLKKKSPERIKINLRDAKKRAVHEIKYDEDNPDNFKIKISRLVRIGESNKEKTPILILDGVGTELNQRRVIIINLNNPKHEMTKLVDPDNTEISMAIRLIAEHPPEDETKEEITIGTDQFGRPTSTTKISRPSKSEKKEQEEKQKAEESNAM